jgi:predicted transposase/invertase (TIGR01784 family)
MIPLDPAVQEYREKARHDHATLLHAAVQEGEAQGVAQGEARKSAEIARNLKNLGLSPEVIEKATGLGPDAAKNL